MALGVGKNEVPEGIDGYADPMEIR